MYVSLICIGASCISHVHVCRVSSVVCTGSCPYVHTSKCAQQTYTNIYNQFWTYPCISALFLKISYIAATISCHKCNCILVRTLLLLFLFFIAIIPIGCYFSFVYLIVSENNLTYLKMILVNNLCFTEVKYLCT